MIVCDLKVTFFFPSSFFSHQLTLRRVLRPVTFFLWVRSQQPFSAKVQIENILGFAGHMVSVAITYLCYHCAKAAIDK